MTNIRTLNDAELNLVAGGIRDRDASEAASGNTSVLYDPAGDSGKS